MLADLIFLLRIALAIWGLSWFHTNFTLVFILYKNAIGILLGIFREM